VISTHGNQICFVRSGINEASKRGVLNGDVEKSDAYPLTPEGISRIVMLANWALGEFLYDEKVMLVSSPFKRARQTAEIYAKALGNIPVQILGDLGERNFGELEGHETKRLTRVWANDQANPNHTLYGVESFIALQHHIQLQVQEIDRLTGKTIILVFTHADPIRAFQARCERWPSRTPLLPVLSLPERYGASTPSNSGFPKPLTTKRLANFWASGSIKKEVEAQNFYSSTRREVILHLIVR